MSDVSLAVQTIIAVCAFFSVQFAVFIALLHPLKKGQAELKSEFKTEISSIKTEISGIKADIESVKTEFKTEISGVKEDIKSLKEAISKA